MQEGSQTSTVTWRRTLPNIFSAALGLYNFKAGLHKMLSFKAEFTYISTTNGTVTLVQNLVDSGLTYMAFSVIIVTEDNPYV